MVKFLVVPESMGQRARFVQMETPELGPILLEKIRIGVARVFVQLDGVLYEFDSDGSKVQVCQ
jgi:hypothetical protein